MMFEEGSIADLDDVAARYADRPGFRLVDYAEVGLPIYRLTLQVYLLSRKPLAPVEEFVLKTLDAGLDTIEDIAGFLGVETEIIEDSLATLVQSDDVYLAARPGKQMQTLSLTKKGIATLRNASLIVPERTKVDIDFDGLMRRPVRNQGWLKKPRELRELGTKEIPPFSKTRPEVEDLPVREVEKVIPRSGRFSDNPGKLLSIQSIERRELYYLPAVLLVFRACVGDETQVGFVVDGQPSAEYELAFAVANGPKKLGILDSLRGSASVLSDDDASSMKAAAALYATCDIEVVRRESIEALTGIKEAQLAAQQADSEDEKRSATEALKLAEDRLAKARAELQNIPIRHVEVHEHPALLERALHDCKERLLLISPWIRAKVVNRAFVRSLEDALRRNVNVYIGYGLGEVDREMNDSDRRAEQDLVRLSEKFSNFKLVRLGNTHAKVLVCDREFVVTTSFNWLSFRGDPNRTFRDEQGMFVGIPEKIDQVFESNLARITEAQTETK